MNENNGQVMLLAGQLRQSAETLHGTMDGVSSEVAHAVPAGNANTIAANVAHAITGIDGIINGLIRGQAPLMMSEQTGLSAPAPMGGDWGDWGQTVQVDLETFHTYAGKVMESAKEYMKSIGDSDLERTVASPSGNEMSVGRWLSIVVLNTAWHTGEIASLKGTHGLKGYPF